MKKFAFVNHGGKVLSIETRCACLKKEEALPGELAIEDIIHPTMLYYYVEIPEGIEIHEGMLFSNGKFIENPEAPDERLANLEMAMMGLMDTTNKKEV